MFSASIARQLLRDPDDTDSDIRVDSHVISAIVSAIPMLLGLLEIAYTSIKRYGGGPRYAISVVLEIIPITLQAPTLSMVITLFSRNLSRGKSITWDAQNRDRLGVSWYATYATFCVFWPQTLLGLKITGLFAVRRIISPLWVLYFIAGLSSAAPFTVFTTSPRVSEIVTRLSLFRISEEAEMSPLLWRVVAPEVRAAAGVGALKKSD